MSVHHPAEIRVIVSCPFPENRSERELLPGRIRSTVARKYAMRGCRVIDIDLRSEIAEGARVVDDIVTSLSPTALVVVLGSDHDWIDHPPAAVEATVPDPRPGGAADRRLSLVELAALERLAMHPLIGGRCVLYAPARGALGGHARIRALAETVASLGGTFRPDHHDIGELVLQVEHDLGAILDRLVPDDAVAGMLAAERRSQEEFGRTRRRVYVEMPEYLDRLDRHVGGDGPPLVVTGESGAGKSALLAWWADRFGREHPDEFLLIHHVGVTAAAGDHHAFLYRVFHEIRERYRIDDPVPTSPAELESALPLWLGHVQRERLILVIDAVNQFDSPSETLTWLPDHLPPNVRLVVSSAPGELTERLAGRDWEILAVEPLGRRERREMTRRFLDVFGHGMGAGRFGRVSDHASSANPLVLRTRLEELSRAAEGELNERIEYFLGADDLDNLYDRVLAGMEREHRAGLVRETLTLIAASRSGLEVAELAELIGIDRGEVERLARALQFHLVSREEKLGLGHDHLRRAIAARYAGRPAPEGEGPHRRLARYFGRMPYGRRRAEEEPWQLMKASAGDALAACLADLDMFRLLYSDRAPHQLIGYWLAVGDGVDPGGIYLAGLDRWRPRDNVELVETLDQIGAFLADFGIYGAAETICRRAIDLHDHLETERHGRISSLETLATLLYRTGRFDEAIAIAARSVDSSVVALGPDHIDVARGLVSLGAIYFTAKLPKAASERFLEAVRICEGLGEPALPVLAKAVNNLGALHQSAGEPERAIAHFEHACRLNEKVYGPDHPEVASNLTNLAFAMERSGDIDRAEILYRRALDINERLLGPGHPELAVLLTNLGSLLRVREDFEAAEPLYRRALALRECAPDASGEELVNSLIRLASLLRQQGRLGEAIDMFERALPGAVRLYGEAYPVPTIRSRLDEMRGQSEKR